MEVGANAGRGNADGADVMHTNTTIKAGDIATIKSGGDTTLKGATIEAKHVVADIGGGLNIESQQNTSSFDSKQQSAGIGVSVCLPPFCYGTSSVSGNLSGAKATGDYASVVEQSGIKAGDGGFQVVVAGNTDLKGGIIASNDKAIDDNKNSLTTGTLTHSDIQNRDIYNASGFSFSGSVSTKVGDQKTASSEADKQAADNKTNPAKPNTSAGAGKASGSQSGTTQSGVSAGTITITDSDAQTRLTGETAEQVLANLNLDVSTDKETKGSLTKNWDGDKLIAEVQAQAQITQAFTEQAHKSVENFVEKERNALREDMKNAKTEDERKEIQEKINDLHMQERVMNVLIGVVSGMGTSALTKETLSAAADKMRQIMIEDSKKFKGVFDPDNPDYVLSNLLEGRSEGVKGDGYGIAGARMDLDDLCGKNNERCVVEMGAGNKPIVDGNGKTKLVLKDGMVQFDSERVGMSLKDFLKTDQGGKLLGATGGLQGLQGTLFGKEYAAGSWQDKLLESFGGTHDYIGGKLSGLYDREGSATRGRSDELKLAHEIWSGVAIAPSAPFAMAELLSPQVWQAITIMMQAVK